VRLSGWLLLDTESGAEVGKTRYAVGDSPADAHRSPARRAVDGAGRLCSSAARRAGWRHEYSKEARRQKSATATTAVTLFICRD
jgi:hypothetical protein